MTRFGDRAIHVFGRTPQKLDRKHRSGDQIENGDTGPHQGAGKFLVPKDGICKIGPQVEVGGIDDAIAKGEVGGKDVAGQSGEEEIKKKEPAGPSVSRGPGLDDSPPEEKSGEEKGELFELVQGRGCEGAGENGWDVPAQQDRGGGQPADDGIGNEFPELRERRNSKKIPSTSSQLWRHGQLKYFEWVGEKDQCRGDGHQQKMLDHVGG